MNSFPVKTLKEASLVLDGHKPLTPDTSDYRKLYVPRPYSDTKLITIAERSIMNNRDFYWFFSGHTGAGKSTELNRIISQPPFKDNFLPIFIDIESEFDIHNIEYTDLIFAMGKGCADIADKHNVKVANGLNDSIKNWGAEILTEQEVHTRTEGSAGLRLSLRFLAFREEIKSGGGKRELIRKNIETKTIEFIRLIDGLSNAIYKETKKRVLCILDGLDHADLSLCLEILNKFFNTINRPKISKIFVVPLPFLNERYVTSGEQNFSTVPNVKVYTAPGSEDLDSNGFSFFQSVIAKYMDLSFIENDVLESLFRLSAGIIRDMIRNTGNACSYAVQSGKNKVTIEDAEKVFNETTYFYRSQLKKDDYKVLREVKKSPYIEGIDGIPPLLHIKAVVYYPNGEGWYGVHPAISKIL